MLFELHVPEGISHGVVFTSEPSQSLMRETIISTTRTKCWGNEASFGSYRFPSARVNYRGVKWRGT
jgi:hypothetical protein